MTQLLCAICDRPIVSMTNENDYMCDRHGFVNVIRTSDGAVLAGDGICGEPHILRMDPRYAAYRDLGFLYI